MYRKLLTISFFVFISFSILFSQTYVEEITTNTTWTAANSPYVLGGGNTTDEVAVYIHNDSQLVTLTIEAGVTIIGDVFRVNFGGGYYNDEPKFIEVGKNGSIKTLGTASNPVKFTSDETEIDKNQWGGIYFNDEANGSTSEFNHTIFEGAGFEFDGAVVIENGSPEFNYCTFQKNKRGIQGSENASPKIYNSIFTENNLDGIDLDGGDAIISGNTFTDNGIAVDLWKNFPAIFENNLIGDDEKFILPEEITENAYVNVPGYYLSGGNAPYFLRLPGNVNDIAVKVTASKLEIGKGVIIKGGTSIPLWPNEEPAYIFLDTGGSLVVKGTENEPVLFTSDEDEISRGQWGGILFAPTANNGGTSIDYAIFEATGFEMDASLMFEAGTPQITNSIFREAYIGIYVNENAMPVIENCSFKKHYYSGIYLEGAGSIIRGNRFEENRFAIDMWHNFPATIENNIIVNDDKILLPDLIDIDYSLPIPGHFLTGEIAPYHIREPQVTNDVNLTIENAVLTIQPGIEIRASYKYLDGNEEPAFALVRNNGSIQSLGTEDNPVKFTNDDEEISYSRWGGIILQSSADNENILFKHTIFEGGGFEFDAVVIVNEGSPRFEDCIFYRSKNGILADSGSSPIVTNSRFTDNYYAGIWVLNNSHCKADFISVDSSRQGIDIDESSFTMTNSLIHHNSSDGMRIYGGTDIQIINSTIKENKWDGIWIVEDAPTIISIENSNLIGNNIGIHAHMETGSSVEIHNSDISGNTSYGIRNRDEIVINAQNNWWGDASGPYDNSNNSNDPTGLYNPYGLGNEVTDWVNYGDWLTFLETEAPNIFCVIDVPNDQGRQVHVGWSASTHDSPGDVTPILKYSLWRLMDDCCDPTNKLNDDIRSLILSSNLQKLQADGWQYIHDITAVPEFDKYYYVAPTLGDSNSTEIFNSTFMVIAHTSSPEIYFKSNSATGYSIDNLPPGQPTNFQAYLIGNSEIELKWNRNLENDFSHYAIYKGSQEGFTPDESNLLETTTDTSFTDNEILDGNYYYLISAFDFNGNESQYSEEVGVLVGVEKEDNQLPTEFSLSQNYPNPFNPTTKIQYDIPKTSHVTLTIYNMNGHVVEKLVNKKQEPGFYSINWDARNVSTGVYIYRIQAGGFSAVKKCLLIK